MHLMVNMDAVYYDRHSSYISKMTDHNDNKEYKLEWRSTAEDGVSDADGVQKKGEKMLDRSPVGSASSGAEFVEYTPSYLRWAVDFRYLIDDSEGVALFKDYAMSEGVGDLLDFWFACEGLKKCDDKSDIKKLISIIFKRYIIKSSIIQLSEKEKNFLVSNLRSNVSESEKRYDKHVFDSAQREVEDSMNASIYPNFLKSDIYINYLQEMQNSAALGAVGSIDSPKTLSTSPYSTPAMEAMNATARDINILNNRNQYLEVMPTLHEDSELQTSTHSSAPNKSHAHQQQQKSQQRHNEVVGIINKEMPTNPNLKNLFTSLKSASLKSPNSSPRLSTEMYPNANNADYFVDNKLVNHSHQSYFRSKSMPNPPNPYHVRYAPFLPTSAQDSESQSLSSHSTNESKSCVGDNCDSGLFSMPQKKKQLQHLNMRQNARMNSAANNSNNAMHNVMPIFQRRQMPAVNANKVIPREFANQLIARLKQVEEQQRKQELLDNMIQMVASNSSANNANAAKTCSANSYKTSSANSNNYNNSGNSQMKQSVREAVKREKLEFPSDESDQSILDRHFAQVFSETPNDTPDRPGCVSPPKLKLPNYDHTGSISGKQSIHLVSPHSTANSGNCFADPTVPVVPVIFRYSTEDCPYKLHIQDRHITLSKFKQAIPAKKGQWQYFFKRVCDVSDRSQVGQDLIYEKISDDNEILPLFDGKIFATIEQINYDAHH